MRWRVLAKLPKAGRDAALTELRLRAKRTPDLEDGADWGVDLPITDELQWYFPTKREADDFARRLPTITDVEIQSLPMPSRTLQDWEGFPTLEELVGGRHPCLNCGKLINAQDPQISTAAWMLGRGSTVRFRCRDCEYENELTIR